MDVEDVVVEMQVDDGPLLDRAKLHPLVDAAHVEAAPIHLELELAPVRRRLVLRQDGRRR